MLLQNCRLQIYSEFELLIYYFTISFYDALLNPSCDTDQTPSISLTRYSNP